MSDKIFVDTNILLYARDLREREKRPIAAEWMTRLWHDRNGCLSVQVLNEYFVNATQKLDPGLSRMEAWDDIEALMAWDPIGMDRALLTRGFAVQARYGLSWWDSLIIAAAEVGGCVEILSEDFDDATAYFGIRVRNPFR